MVRIICTGPAQDWPSDDSDFDEENLPGYRPPGKSKRKNDEYDDEADSNYSDSEDVSVKKRQKTSKKKRTVITKDHKERKRDEKIKRAGTRTNAARHGSLENVRSVVI